VTGQWIPAKEAAEKLGVSERTVRRSIQDGTIPGRRIGKRLLFVERAYVEAKEQSNHRYLLAHNGTYRTENA
jgi:excisionase family DNA binding protein